jgi:hypothetical protein
VSLDPDEVRDVACAVTAGSDVCETAAPREIEPVDFDPPNVGGGGGGGGGIVLVVLLVAVVVAGLVWLVRAWFAGRSAANDDGDSGHDDLDEDRDEEVAERIIDHETPPDRWRRSAAEHRAAGRFRDAIRCEYRGLVGDLARAGFVDEIPGRTSGEERAQIAELAPHVLHDFGTAADLFDQAWFNDDAVVAEHDERFVSASTAVLGSVRVR